MALPARRMSSIFLAIVLVVLILSVAAFSQSIISYRNQRPLEGLNFMVIGVSGFILSAYLLFQMKRRVRPPAIKEPRVSTMIVCQKCGFKNIREFKRGDYVFKEMEPCPKCNEKMIIASIYREIKTGEKG